MRLPASAHDCFGNKTLKRAENPRTDVGKRDRKFPLHPMSSEYFGSVFGFFFFFYWERIPLVKNAPCLKILCQNLRLFLHMTLSINYI